jgi:hypothetical protein
MLKVDNLLLSSTLGGVGEDVHCLEVSSASVDCAFGTVSSTNTASVFSLSGEGRSSLSITSLDGVGTLVASSQDVKTSIGEARTTSDAAAFDVCSWFFLAVQRVESMFALRVCNTVCTVSASVLAGRVVLEQCKVQLSGSSWTTRIKARNSDYTLSCHTLNELVPACEDVVVSNESTRCRIFCSFFEAANGCIVSRSTPSTLLLSGTFVTRKGNVVRADRNCVVGVLPSTCLSSVSGLAVNACGIVCNLGAVTVSSYNCVWQQPRLVSQSNIPSVFLDGVI